MLGRLSKYCIKTKIKDKTKCVDYPFQVRPTSSSLKTLVLHLLKSLQSSPQHPNTFTPPSHTCTLTHSLTQHTDTHTCTLSGSSNEYMFQITTHNLMLWGTSQSTPSGDLVLNSGSERSSLASSTPKRIGHFLFYRHTSSLSVIKK